MNMLHFSHTAPTLLFISKINVAAEMERSVRGRAKVFQSKKEGKNGLLQ